MFIKQVSALTNVQTVYAYCGEIKLNYETGSMKINNRFIHIFFGGSALGGILCGRNYKGAKGYSILILGGSFVSYSASFCHIAQYCQILVQNNQTIFVQKTAHINDSIIILSKLLKSE